MFHAIVNSWRFSFPELISLQESYGSRFRLSSRLFGCLVHKGQKMMHINRSRNYKNQSRNAKIEVETLKSKWELDM